MSRSRITVPLRATALTMWFVAWPSLTAWSAEELRFQLAASRSHVTVSGTFLGMDLHPQPGPTDSSTTMVRGSLHVGIDRLESPDVIEFLSGTVKLADNGSWLPQLGGGAVADLGDADPANVALWITDDALGNGWGAIRDLEIDVSSLPLTLDQQHFNPILFFDTMGGRFDYNLDLIIASRAGSQLLAGRIENITPDQGTLEIQGGLATLTIPLWLPSITSLNLTFTGELVANTLISPVVGDLDGDGSITANDIDTLTMWLWSEAAIPDLDLDHDGALTMADRSAWIATRFKTYSGDANLDGEFSTADLVAVFERGEYEDLVANNSTWASGDWNGDGDFSSSDLVEALAEGGYEQGPRRAGAVPEPSSWFPALTALGGSLFVRQKSTNPP